ncbi:hypothetical protein FORMB_17090 [Formosa sp. Hel1_33_131]|uniref:PIN domain-containing protein n=1 Tax=Formosa sp. Hel1_33_131 TaxID=1336794 RepID=UPI00084E28C9|nr:PIN domain-containing protein [Formosa sp. Hel1_33_131]AOR28748.1 hypothetical protein FORMB_17090 [Formosa sp. Hel1_33_131]
MTFIDKLIAQIDLVQPIVNLMLDNSSIFFDEYKQRINPRLIVVGFSKHRYSRKDEKNQIKARQEFDKFYNNFELLLDKATPNNLKKIDKAKTNIINLIEQTKVPVNIESGKNNFLKYTKVFKEFLELLQDEETATMIIPDTNSIIQYPDPISYKNIANSSEFDFVILPTVLSELDKLKISHRNEDFRKKVKSVIKRLKGYRKQGDVLKGVTVNKTVTLKMIATEPNFEKTLNWLDPNNNDDRIIANALELQINKPSNNLIFVSSDMNFQNKAQLANLTIFDTDDLNS